jgi:hypothetical protein
VGLLSLMSDVTNCNAAKFVKKLLGEKFVETVLQRLDRLTQDESRMAAAETLKVVYGLVQEMSERIHTPYYPFVIEHVFYQMERHPMTVSGKPLVGIVNDNILVSRLIQSHVRNAA